MRVLIFDSGVGGLSVAEEIRRLVPDLCQIYVADDAYRPYGDKPEAELRQRLSEILPYLVKLTQSDLVVIACNTASTAALTDIREAVEVPVIGVVPAIKPASEQTRSGKIALLGTPATVAHPYVDKLIESYARDCNVIRHGSVALVEQAELKLSGQPVDLDHIRDDVAPLMEHPDIDVGVMACTHFPLLRRELEEMFPNITWIDSGAAIARRVETIVTRLSAGKARAPCADQGYALIINDGLLKARHDTFVNAGIKAVTAMHIPL